MSDFLQFVDRVPTLPNRKKITHADSSVEYATIEYADEPIETGTPLNKEKFDCINNILGYNITTGFYDSAANIAKYNINNDISNMMNKQKLLCYSKDRVLAPATDIQILLQATLLGQHFCNINAIDLDNDNVMILGNKVTSNYSLYIAIISKSGNIVKSPTMIYNSLYSGGIGKPVQALKLKNGNIIVIGIDNSDRYGSLYGIILDQTGNVIVNGKSLGSYFSNPTMIEMSDGNICIVGSNTYSSTYTSNFMIINNQLNTIKSRTQISYSNEVNDTLKELPNGNIMIACGRSRTEITIIDKQGNIIKSHTEISTHISYPNIIITSNNNIMVIGYQSSSPYNIYAVILDQSGNVIQTETNITTLSGAKFIHLSNNNILIYNGTRLIVIGEDRSIKKDINLSYSNVNGSKAIEMANGNILYFYYDSNYSSYVTILDKQLNLIKESISIGQYFQYVTAVELSNSNILLLGSKSDTDGYMSICIPKASGALSTLNNIELDTFLEKDKYYELIYDETNNRFIAEEVRT